jgi:hypothetical protein
MSRDSSTKSLASTPRGLSNLEVGARQALRFEIGEVVCRMSYKDVLVVQSVIAGALKRPQTNLSKRKVSKNSSPREDQRNECKLIFRKKLFFVHANTIFAFFFSFVIHTQSVSHVPLCGLFYY